MTDHEDESRIARASARPADRSALRDALLDARRRLSAQRRRTDGEALAGRLHALLGDVGGRTIAIYHAVRGEPDLGALPDRWDAAGARLALPVVVAADAPLRFDAWRPGEPTVAGAYRIPVPASAVPVRPTVLVVPCLGFDARGYRLGYGGGFYDRSLAALDADGGPRPLAIGVAWDDALLEAFDPLPTDRRLDAVVTPRRAFPAHAGAAPRSP